MLLADLMDRAAALLATATGRGLGILEMRLLVALRAVTAPADTAALAAEVGVDRGLVDRAVRRLAARGLIEVDVAGGPGATLAPAGRVVLAEVDRSVILRLRDFVGTLDRGQRLRLEGALHLIGGGR